MKKSNTCSGPKKKILEQIKFYRAALENAQNNLDGFEGMVIDLPNRQLDADDDEESVKLFGRALQELCDDSSCMNSYAEKMHDLFYGD